MRTSHFRKTWSIPLFKVFGIPLDLHITFLIILVLAFSQGFALAGLTGGLSIVTLVVLLFMCVVLHELGHSLTARIFGVRTHRILLMPIGGMAQFSHIPREPHRELAIVAAGPAVNFVIAGLLALMIALTTGFPLGSRFLVPTTPGEMLSALMIANLIMGTFNLLPIFPMDGGRLLRAFLAMAMPYVGATRWAAHLAKPLAIGGVCLALFSPGGPYWIGAILFAFILIGGELEYQYVKRQGETPVVPNSLRGMRISHVTEPAVSVLPTTATVEQARQVLDASGNRACVVTQGPATMPVPIESYFSTISREELEAATSAPNSSGDTETAAPAVPRTLMAVAKRRAMPLQADWPLETFVTQLLQHRPMLLPVARDGNIIGVLDTTTLAERLKFPAADPFAADTDTRRNHEHREGQSATHSESHQPDEGLRAPSRPEGDQPEHRIG